MQYTKPDYYDSFLCGGEGCSDRCPAPADMTWMQLCASHGELGLSLACPQAARLILLRQQETEYRKIRDDSPPAFSGITQGQLSLMLDALTTLDIILKNRTMELRSNVMLALTYAAEFDPMIGSELRYDFDELDWGYTEQPWKQLSSVTPLQGFWEEKQEDLLAILRDFLSVAGEAEIMASQLRGTIALLEGLSPQAYRDLRDAFEEYMKPRSYVQEHLLEYLIHRYYFRDSERKTILPGVRFSFSCYAVISALAARVYHEAGILTDETLVNLCSQFSRCFEGNIDRREALFEKMAAEPVYERQRLQRMLWK